MKYTRYNIKKKRNLSGMIIIILVSAFALAGGTLLAKIIFKGQPAQNKTAQTVQNKNNSSLQNKNGTVSNNTDTNVSEEKFTVYFVQCGYFGNKENADKTKKDIENSKIKTVVISDNSKYRVVAYVGDEKGSDSVLKSLKDKSINAMRMKVDISKTDDADNQVSEIVKGYEKLLDALNKDDVKSVKTSDFKKWASGLKALSAGNNIKVLNELKTSIKSLPDEIKKEESDSIYNEIFKAVNVYRH